MPKSSSRGADSGLRELPARRIVAAIGDAAARWTDADYPPRVRATAAIVQRTGYTEPVVDYALDRLFGEVTSASLTAAIEGEIGSLRALDGFVARDARPDAFARGIDGVAIVASDTTIGVALPAVVFALCAKCDVDVRDRSDALLAAFADTLTQERPELGAAVRVHAGIAPEHPRWRAALRDAGVVVAFGGDDALRALRSEAAPDARFVGFGHRTSATYVARESLENDAHARSLAAGTAVDALLYDGDGCLSSHVVFVERGGDVSFERFSHLLEEACAAVAVEFPRGSSAPAGAVLAYRDGARFRAAQGTGGVAWGEGGSYLLVIEPPRHEAPPLLARCLAVYGVDGVEEFTDFVASHAVPLEAVAVADPAAFPDIVAAIAASGAARVARIGALQSPLLAAEHGGVGRITPFVRWVTRDA